MANPSADYPIAIHTSTDTSAFSSQYLGSSSPTHTDVHGKVESEIVALQTKLGIGSSSASSASTNSIMLKGATNTSWTPFNTALATSTTDSLPGGSTNLYSQWSADTGGIIYGNHIAIGNNADVNGTGQINSFFQDTFGIGTNATTQFIQETVTGTPPIYTTGLGIKLASNYSSTPTTVTAIEALAATLAGNAQGVLVLAGFFGGAAHRGTGTVSFGYGTPGVVQNQSSGTITTAFGIYGQASNTSTGTLTNGTSLYAAAGVNSGGGTYTNAYGLYIEGITQATNSYGAVIGAATTNTLWVNNISDSTTASGGITFGLSKDTNLYRSAANTLKTDDALSTNGRIQKVTSTAINYTILSSDEVIVATATATLTLPVASGSGRTYRIVCNSGSTTIDGNGSDTVKGETTFVLSTGEDLIITDTASGRWE